VATLKWIAVLSLCFGQANAFLHSSPVDAGCAARLRGGRSGTCMSACPTVDLNDGTKHPMVGFGTYKVGFIPASASAATDAQQQAGGTQVTARQCVTLALEVGYRFLDCAQFYGNEKEVGHGIKDSGIERDQLFLASKVWTSSIYEGRHAVRQQVLQTLADLQTDYLDLYLVHWPVPGKHVEAYKELEALQAEGKIKSIGVSNYVVQDLEELMSASSVVPSINQIEVNPFLYRRQTLEWCASRGIQIQAYRALRDGKAFEDATIVRVAAKHSKTPAQVLGRWCVQKGVIYIPKSVKKERMEENMAVFDWALDSEDVAALDALTTPQNLQAFKALYIKCVTRDTPIEGTPEAAALTRSSFTVE